MNINLKLSNFQKICRTCLIEKDNLKAIFNILNLLKECTSIQIDMEDDLPKLICVECTKKLNTAFEFRKQCELTQKILLQFKDFGATRPVKFESNGSNPQSHKTENLETNEIDIKSEDSFNINENNSDTCDEINKFKINYESNILKTKALSFGSVGETIETTTNENKNSLDVLKKQNFNLENINTNTVKNSLSCNLDDQPLNKRLKIENSDSISEDYDCDITIQSSDESIVLRKNKYKKKSIKPNDKRKVKKADLTLKNGISCPQCKKSFELEADLEIHMLKHKKFDEFICPKCSKSFENERSLKQHFNTHMIDKPYKCNFCDKSFAKSGDRNRHLRIHTGEKPFICSSCGKRFTDSSRLSAHMKYHLGVKNFVCTVCSKSFMFPSELRSHMRVHTGEKPYLCTECGEGFSHSDGLKLHKLKHTGERPYSCTECDKNFLLNKHLKIHMRSHTGEKPYMCKICEMGFARSDSLVIHNRIHTGERPYSCNICEKTFKSSKDLSQHKRTHNKRR